MSPYRDHPVDPREERREAIAKMLGRKDVVLEDVDAFNHAVWQVATFGAGIREVPGRQANHASRSRRTAYRCNGCNALGFDYDLMWHRCPPDRLRQEATTQGLAAVLDQCWARDRARMPWWLRWVGALKEAFS